MCISHTGIMVKVWQKNIYSVYSNVSIEWMKADREPMAAPVWVYQLFAMQWHFMVVQLVPKIVKVEAYNSTSHYVSKNSKSKDTTKRFSAI